MGSQRVKYAMAHLSHKQHISLLARPNWRRIRRMDPNTLPDPFTTSRSALKSRATKRIKIMAQPKHASKKYEPAKAPSVYVRLNPKILTAKASKRTMDLALPTKRVLLSTMGLAEQNENIGRNVRGLLSKVQSSRYQKYRVFCNMVQQREARRKRKLMAKLRKALSKPEDWQRHMQALARLAVPKKRARPKPPDRGKRRRKWRPVNMRRVEELAQPASKETPEIRDPFTVPAAALTYRISNRLKEIAFRKNPPEIIEPRIPGAVSPAAIKAIASPRTIILAKPVVRPAGMETDLREDAFTVSPSALRARCSKRLKLLAKPKTYGK